MDSLPVAFFACSFASCLAFLLASSSCCCFSTLRSFHFLLIWKWATAQPWAFYTCPWCKPHMHDCITSNIFEDGSNLAFWLTCMSSEGKYCNQNQTKAMKTAIRLKFDFKTLWLVNFYPPPFWKGSQRSPQCTGLSSELQRATRFQVFPSPSNRSTALLLGLTLPHIFQRRVKPTSSPLPQTAWF